MIEYKQVGGSVKTVMVECPFCGARKDRDYWAFADHLETEHSWSEVGWDRNDRPTPRPARQTFDRLRQNATP